MAAIENKVRNAAGGQDPAALRDAAATAVRAALSGDAAKQAEANDKAAEALAKAQNISTDEAKAQVARYQQQYKEAVGQAKEQAKQAADATAKRVSQGALFSSIALLLGALAAFFAGRAARSNQWFHEKGRLYVVEQNSIPAVRKTIVSPAKHVRRRR